MLEVYRTKMPNVSVAAFLLFGTLFLAFGMIIRAGVFGQPADAFFMMLRGILCLAAAVALATRMAVAPAAASVLCVAVLFAGQLPAPNSPVTVTNPEARKDVVEELSHFPWERRWKEDVARLVAASYAEPPEFVKRAADRTAAVKKWVAAYGNEVQRLRASCYSHRNDKEMAPPSAGGLSDKQLADAIVENINAQESLQPAWYYFFIHEAYSGHLSLDSAPLTPEESASVEARANAYVDEHPDVISTYYDSSSMRVYDEAAEAQSRPLSVNALVVSLAWMLLFGLVPAWIGRYAFVHPFSPVEFPGRVVSGLRRLVRKDRTAPLRIIAGLAIVVLSALGLIWMMRAGARPPPVFAKAFSAVVLLGLVIAGSAIEFEEPVVHEQA
jgi:hypothetical protein